MAHHSGSGLNEAVHGFKGFIIEKQRERVGKERQAMAAWRGRGRSGERTREKQE